MSERPDFFYNVTYDCGDGFGPPPSWDNNATTALSRIFMVLLLALAVGAMLGAGSVPERTRSNGQSRSTPGPSEEDEDAVLPTGSREAAAPRKERKYDLDFARIVCVHCVVTEHAGSVIYSMHNVVFVLQWVLPYLYLTSGICFMISGAPLWLYALRLAVLLAVGVSFNWAADVATGRDWQHDFGTTVYQMFYVVMLILMAFLTGPLRVALKWRHRHPDAAPPASVKGVVLFHSAMALLGLCFYVANVPIISFTVDPSPTGEDDWNHRAKAIFDTSSIILMNNSSILLLAALASWTRPSQWHSWIMLVVIYVPRVIAPFPYAGFSHCCNLYIFGMFVERWGLKGDKAIAAWVKSYWPLLLAVMMPLLTPQVTGRCDIEPAYSAFLRLRFYILEVILTVCLVSGAFNTGDPYRCTGWLNNWALFAYCSHVCWYRLLGVPWGAFLTYGFLGVFYARHRLSLQRRLDKPTRGDVLSQPLPPSLATSGTSSSLDLPPAPVDQAEAAHGSALELVSGRSSGEGAGHGTNGVSRRSSREGLAMPLTAHQADAHCGSLDAGAV